MVAPTFTNETIQILKAGLMEGYVQHVFDANKAALADDTCNRPFTQNYIFHMSVDGSIPAYHMPYGSDRVTFAKEWL